MQKCRLFIVLAVLVFGGIFFLTSYGIGRCAEHIRLGFAGPLSGELSSYGISSLRGVELAIEEANNGGGIMGRLVDLYVEDDMCLPKDASIRASKMVVRDVHAVIGHICSGATRAALDIYRKAEIITVSPSATHPELTQSGDYPNFFRTIASDDVQARVQISFVLDVLKLKKIVVLHDMTVYGKSLAEILKTVLHNNGRSELVFHQGIPPGTIDYSPIVQKLKKTQADVVIYGGYHPQASKIISQMRMKKMKTIFVSGDGIKDEAFIVSTGKFAEGVYATAPKDTSNLPKAIAAIDAYKKAYGTYPGAFFLNAYAAANIIMAAIQEAGSTNYTTVLKVLKSLHVGTVMGKMSFDERGDAIGPDLGFSVYRIEMGKFVKVK